MKQTNAALGVTGLQSHSASENPIGIETGSWGTGPEGDPSSQRIRKPDRD